MWSAASGVGISTDDVWHSRAGAFFSVGMSEVSKELKMVRRISGMTYKSIACIRVSGSRWL